MTSVSPLVTPPSPESLPAVTLDEIRRTLAARILWCPLPRSVAAGFARRRLEEFALLARQGWPLLLILVVGVGVLGWQNFGEGASARDSLVWWRGIALQFCLLSSAILLLHHPRVLPHYQPLILVVGALNLSMAVTGAVVLDSERLARSLSYVGMLIITIQVLALRLSLLTAGICGILGILLGIVWSWLVWERWPDWSMLLWSTTGSLLVTLFVGAILERQERISYLQGLLLAHESAERERLNQELDRLAHQDVLSGLANRRHFNLMLEQEWERLSRARQPLAALFIDVDHFKAYNDTYGHAAGDDCLAAIGAVLLQAARRPGDVAARYGGEEFVLLLPGADIKGACDVASRILHDIDALNIAHAASSVSGHVTVSIGLAAQIPQPGLSSQDLLVAADQALYAAKHAGRHRIEVAEGASTATV